MPASPALVLTVPITTSGLLKMWLLATELKFPWVHCKESVSWASSHPYSGPFGLQKCNRSFCTTVLRFLCWGKCWPWFLMNDGFAGTSVLLPTVACVILLLPPLPPDRRFSFSCVLHVSSTLTVFLVGLLYLLFLFGGRMGLLSFGTSGMVSARDNPKFVVTVPLFPFFTLPWCPHPQTPWAFLPAGPSEVFVPSAGPKLSAEPMS